MPRTRIKIDYEIEYLSVLNADGELDESLMPDCDAGILGRLYEYMLRARRFDERRLELQREGHIGTFAPVKGQEAAQIGAVSVLDEEDWMVPSFRESAAALWRGAAMSDMLLYDAGYNEGGHAATDSRDLPIAVPVASQLPHAAGIAYASRLLGTSEITLAFFGDGATSEGDFHETLNFAGVFGLPIVFVCQNNQWAISVPREQQTHSQTLAQKAIAYGIPGIVVDGNDVLAVHCAVRDALQRARHGDGPTLIECETYRLEVHTTADDPDRYRDKEELEYWQARDPLERFAGLLRNRGLLPPEERERLEAVISREIDSAWEEARTAMSQLEDAALFEHVYAQLPDYTQRQRSAFEAADD